MNSKTIQAAKDIEQGKLVCFPTETVYALAANPFNKKAIESIYKIKGRDFNKPLALLINNIDDVKKIAQVNEIFLKLAKAFCPGPITFILPKIENCPLPEYFNKGTDTIAVRMPKNDIALEVITNANCYVAATSTNPSGKPEATTAQQITDYFGDKIENIIDCGECDLKVASTIVDLTSSEIKILREGLITKDMILKQL